MKYLISSVTVFILICISQTISLGQNQQSTFDSILKDYFEDDGSGVVVLVADGDHIIYRKAMGLADVEKNIRLKVDHSLRIGSITKQFTAMAILKLVHEGKLSLEDRIQKFIPDFEVNTNPITIRHLLNHTSGLQNQNDIPEWETYATGTNVSLMGMIDLFKNEIPSFVPGDKIQYSNLGYIVLTHVIEMVTKQTYAEYLNDHFLKSLNMNSTYYGDQPHDTKNSVIGFSKSNKTLHPAQSLNMNLPQGAGGLTSSVDDLYKWNQAVFNSDQLGKYVGDAHQYTALNNGQLASYGYGWQFGLVKGRKSVRHDGIINGYTSYQIYLPEEKAYAVILTNCDCTQKIAEIAAQLVAEVIDDSYDQETVTLTTEELSKYKGIFTSESGEEQIVNIQDDGLYFYPKGGTKVLLKPLGGNRFYLENSISEIVFLKNDSGYFDSFEYSTIDHSTHWDKTNNLKSLTSVKLSTDELLKYCGEYQVPNAFILTVTLEENQLYGTVGNDRKTLSPYADDSFFAKENDIVLKFKNENRSITGVTLIQNQEIFAERVN